MERKNVVFSLRNLGVSYKKRSSLLKVRRHHEFWALKSVSFDVYQGEVLGLIGRNGAGKSTILSLLNGIIGPDRGEFINYGYTSSLLALNAGFIPHISGRKNIFLNALLLGMKKEDIVGKVEQIIEVSELGQFIDEPLSTYSTGMAARLGFATAYHMNPDVILVDETLGVGDAAFQRKSKKMMLEKIKSNKTVVVVSHSEATLKELCSRLVWIHEGEVREQGSTLAVLEKYNEFLKEK